MYKDIVIFLILHFIFTYFNISKFNIFVSRIQGSKINIGNLPYLIHVLFLMISYKVFVLNKNFTVKEALYFGIILFGFFNLSNYILFNNWNLKLTITDSLYGGLLFALTLYLSRQFILASKKKNKKNKNDKFYFNLRTY
jgi:uncharacterized membrane protein